MPTGVYKHKREPVIDRLFRFIVFEPNGCWTWTGGCFPSGYGSFRIDTTEAHHAHRVVYTELVGPIPEGLELDHTCHNPYFCNKGNTCPHRKCVNPAHLEPVTPAENMRRSGKAGRLAYYDRQRAITHCPKGHAYTPENTYVYGGCRQCKSCCVLRKAASDKSKKEAKLRNAGVCIK